MKPSRIDLKVSSARFLKMKETFALACTDENGAEIEVRLPLDGVGKIMEAMVAARNRGTVIRSQMPTGEDQAIATGIEITPIDGFGIRFALRMQDEAWAEFLIPSRLSSAELKAGADRLLAIVRQIAPE